MSDKRWVEVGPRPEGTYPSTYGYWCQASYDAAAGQRVETIDYCRAHKRPHIMCANRLAGHRCRVTRGVPLILPPEERT